MKFSLKFVVNKYYTIFKSPKTKAKFGYTVISLDNCGESFSFKSNLLPASIIPVG